VTGSLLVNVEEKKLRQLVEAQENDLEYNGT
jgi:hypothetical protein